MVKRLFDRETRSVFFGEGGGFGVQTNLFAAESRNDQVDGGTDSKLWEIIFEFREEKKKKKFEIESRWIRNLARRKELKFSFL